MISLQVLYLLLKINDPLLLILALLIVFVLLSFHVFQLFSDSLELFFSLFQLLLQLLLPPTILHAAFLLYFDVSFRLKVHFFLQCINLILQKLPLLLNFIL